MSASRFVLPLITCVLGLALVGCAADRPKPTVLEDIKSTVSAKALWERRVGGVGFPIAMALHQDQLAVADDDGSISVFDVPTGKGVWRGETKAKPDAGVGFDGKFASLVTRDNVLVVVEGGVERWRKRLDSRVVTAPLVAGERVFVLGVDRTVKAFDAADGTYLWQFKRPGDALTLAHPGVLTAYKNLLIAGQGGRWVALDPLTGSLRWETPLGSPRGTNEVERLADLVGPAARLDQVFCARSFQNAVGCVNAERGASVTTAVVGGTLPVAMDPLLLYSADASDRVTARRRQGAEIAWSSERLLYRDLSGPAVVSTGVVFGDLDGHLHLLDRDSGRTLLRQSTDGSRVMAVMSLGENRLVALTQRGGLFAFQFP